MNGNKKIEPLKQEIFDDCSAYYSFSNGFIQLDKNSFLDKMNEIPSTDFKKCSKFAHRFKNLISDSVYIDGAMFSILNDKQKKEYKLLIHKNNRIIKAINLPIENPLPEVHSYTFQLLPFKGHLIMLMKDEYTTHYLICKYNSNGDEVMRKEIEHTFIDHPEPNTNHHNSYLNIHSLTASQIIFSSHLWSVTKHKTIVFSMNDFSTIEFDETAHGIIYDEKEENLAGFITITKSHAEVQMIDKKKYKLYADNLDKGCEMIQRNNLLYIANYHPIATGSSLYCFNLFSGKIKWKADVLQLNVGHSEYSNKVTLSLFKNKLIMEGNESYGKYVQLFDFESGKRIAQFGDAIETQ